MPFPVRCYLSLLAVVALAAIAALPLSHTQPLLLAAMCALVAVTERLSRVKVGVAGGSMSVSLVVTIITVLVLTPPEAAVVGVVASLAAPRPAVWTWSKQIATSAMSSVVTVSGAAVCYLTGGHGAVGRAMSFPGYLWPFAAAVTTCLVANGMILAGYMALSDDPRFGDVLRGSLQRAALPYYSSGVLALIFLSLWNDIGWYTAPLVVVPMYIAHWSLSQYASEEAAHDGTIAALVQAVEIKDSYTRGHSERVARGAEMLARQLRMPHERVQMLRFAGLLHDIGKLGVPTRLLTSTGGLTEEEYKLLCMHPNHGVAVLRDIRFLTEVYDGVLYHHERLDGRGYPTGKSGDQIPEFARIIGVADAFDAMTSTRSYRAARSVQEAVAELRRGAGTQFDPVLVQAFEAALELAERAGRPWVPTELPASPEAGETAVAADSGPWPLPKRVPGFSFADHDDPFVPAEWFSDWYPSWLAEAWEGQEGEGPRGPYDWPFDGRQELLRPGGIPGPRSGEPTGEALEIDAGAETGAEAGAEAGDGAGDAAGPGTGTPAYGYGADLDGGWSARMHSAVVGDGGAESDREPEQSGAGESADSEQTPSLGRLWLRDVSQSAAMEQAGPEPGGVAPRSFEGTGTGADWFSRGAVGESVGRTMPGPADSFSEAAADRPAKPEGSADAENAENAEDAEGLTGSEEPTDSEGSAA